MVDVHFMLNAGLDEVADYLSAHVLTCLIPAFFIAGAVAALLSKEYVIRYFGAGVAKWKSYTVASLSGTILAVCSCTILPMFAGLYRRGAGIGPATAFLYSGPAINLLAIVLTARVLGFDLGLARAIGAVGMAYIIGLGMATLFPGEAASKANLSSEMPVSSPRPWKITLGFLALLVAILMTAAASPAFLPWTPKIIAVFAMVLVVIYLLKRYFTRGDRDAWMHETWSLAKMIFPILIVGVFITGVLGYFIPYGLVRGYLGANSFASCLLASVVGALLYMPTLLEVPIVGTLFGYSSGVISPGAALSLLLAGPSLSLPNMIVIERVLGLKKGTAYIILVVLLSTISGMAYGNLVS